MSSENIHQKINLILCDLPQGITHSDIETFLSPYKSSIESIQINEKTPHKATAAFKDLENADKCRQQLNQKKIKNKTIRIMREEKNFLLKNKDSKNNLYVKNIPKNKDARELYEYFLQYGDVFSLKVNENEKGDFPRTAFLTFYKEEDAKKCIEENKNKKIWGSDMEVQYQKNSNEKGYNNNYNNYNNNYHSSYNNYNYNYNNDRHLKINITNLPDNYEEKEILKLCEEFGKCEICDIKKNNRNGKFAIVKFSKESEAKNALQKLNEKEVEKNKLIVKELHYSHNYQNNNNYYNKRPGNFPLFYNFPMPKLEDLPYEKNNLYVTNIPNNATKEDLEKTFGQFGPIKNIRLDEDTSISKELKEKIKFLNKGFGYILYEKDEDAAKAIESLNGKYLIGFETHFKNLSVEYFVPKEKRNLLGTNNVNMPNPSLYFQGQMIPPSPYYMPIPMPFNPLPNNQMRPPYYSQGNYKNGFGFRRNNNRGRGNRGGKNFQRKNKIIPQYEGNNSDKKNEEKKNLFDRESFDKIENDEEKRDFLGEQLFNLIQENKIIKEKNADSDTVGKITGMILGIPNMEEIITVLENQSLLESRIKEALNLMETTK